MASDGISPLRSTHRRARLEAAEIALANAENYQSKKARDKGKRTSTGTFKSLQASPEQMAAWQQEKMKREAVVTQDQADGRVWAEITLEREKVAAAEEAMAPKVNALGSKSDTTMRPQRAPIMGDRMTHEGWVTQSIETY